MVSEGQEEMLREINEELDNAEKKLKQLKEKRDGINEEARVIRDLRDEMNKKRRELLDSIKDLREKRGKLIEERRLRKERIRYFSNQLKGLKSIMKGGRRDGEKGSLNDPEYLKMRIQYLEEKFQTTPMELKKERVVMGEIKKLKNTLKEIEEKVKVPLEEELGEDLTIEEKIERIEDILEKEREALKDLEKNLNNTKEEMDKYLPTLNHLRREADHYHKEYKRKREVADGYHKRFLELRERVLRLRENRRNIYMEAEEIIKKHHQDVKNALENEEAIEDVTKMELEKLKKGKKVSL